VFSGYQFVQVFEHFGGRRCIVPRRWGFCDLRAIAAVRNNYDDFPWAKGLCERSEISLAPTEPDPSIDKYSGLELYLGSYELIGCNPSHWSTGARPERDNLSILDIQQIRCKNAFRHSQKLQMRRLCMLNNINPGLSTQGIAPDRDLAGPP
jgi:hypothetical protein